MKKKEKIPASIPLAEFNKKIAKEYREKAQNLIECADIIEGKEPTNDKYDLLKEFVEWLKDQNAAYDEILGFDMIYMDTSQLDDMLEYFIKEREK